MHTGTLDRNAGHRRSIDQINADYRATVARRQAAYARREAASRAFWLLVTQACAAINFLLCGAMIVMSAAYMLDAIQSHQTPTPIGMFVAGFFITQACCWTYVILFPRYIASLQ